MNNLSNISLGIVKRIDRYNYSSETFPDRIAKNIFGVKQKIKLT